MSSPTLPTSMKALIVKAPGQPLQLATLPVPSVTPGSAIVKILTVQAGRGIPHVIDGSEGLPFPPNFIPGIHAVGRVVATGPDATSLKIGQLVMIEGFIRARDDPDEVNVLLGLTSGFSAEAQKFMADNWAHGCLAEYIRVPLENCYALDEKRLCSPPAEGGLGYALEELLQLQSQLVTLGGLRAIDVKPGERVIVSPSTGIFSGAAVQVAVALGAQVIATGRDLPKLEQLQQLFPAGRVQVVQITGDVQADTAALKQWGPVDAYLDITPPSAAGATHPRSCLAALRKYGRACLMGSLGDDVAVSNVLIMLNSLTIRGQYMYERADAKLIIKMAESGVLKLGKEGGNEVLGRFKFEEADEAFALAVKRPEIGKLVAFVP